MKITVDVSRVIIVKGRGADKINLVLNLPDAEYPFAKNSLSFGFEAAGGTGVGFVKHYFEFPEEIIEVVNLYRPAALL